MNDTEQFELSSLSHAILYAFSCFAAWICANSRAQEEFAFDDEQSDEAW